MTEERSQEQERINASQSTLTTPDKNTHKRRKLLKGAVALPVIMTLYSGAALARTSNITGEADSIENAVFKDTVDGPQLLCVYPDIQQQQIPGGPYDLGPYPQGVLIQQPQINPSTDTAETVMTKKLQQLEDCHARGGIMISAVAYTSIMSKSGININATL